MKTVNQFLPVIVPVALKYYPVHQTLGLMSVFPRESKFFQPFIAKFRGFMTRAFEVSGLHAAILDIRVTVMNNFLEFAAQCIALL